MDDHSAGGNPVADIRELGESVGKRLLSGAGKVSARVQEERPLGADVLESDDAYLVVFDAPGVEMDDVQVRFEEGAVRVRLDRFRDVHEGYEMVFPGRGLTLEGHAALPEDAAVDPTAAEATLTEAGALHVEVPKVVADSHAESDDPGDTTATDDSAGATDDDATDDSAGATDDSAGATDDSAGATDDDATDDDATDDDATDD